MTTPTHTAFAVRDRGQDRKAFWARIGSAWINRDGSCNLQLDALPIDGKIVLRLRKANENDGIEEAEAVRRNRQRSGRREPPLFALGRRERQTLCLTSLSENGSDVSQDRQCLFAIGRTERVAGKPSRNLAHESDELIRGQGA